MIQRDWELQYAEYIPSHFLVLICFRRFAALELQSLKYELEVRVLLPAFAIHLGYSLTLFRLNVRVLLQWS